MKTTVNAQGALTLDRGRLLDYVSLAKPELTFLSVLTALAGFLLASGGAAKPLSAQLLLHTLAGTALVGGGAGALNQFIERRYDRLMKRTEQRPLPSGRLAPFEALLFGCGIAIAGIAELAFFVNPLTSFLAEATLVSYLFLYTPLKRITPHATLVGAVPGAIPPLMGWAAARNTIDGDGLLLFGILFFWQMPHFLSLAWMYRRDYSRAGYRLLSVIDLQGTQTCRHILVHSLALVLMTIIPWLSGMFGIVYLTGAVLLGGGFLAAGSQLQRSHSNMAARRLFAASLVYLPALMFVMVFDRLLPYG